MEFSTFLESWGKAGAGILFICQSDGSALLVLRSGLVEDPHIWGIPGGAVKGTEGYRNSTNSTNGETFSRNQLWNTAKEEAMEELGTFPEKYSVRPNMEIYDTNPSSPNSFKFYTFIVDISFLQKQKIITNHKLNWENKKLKWYPIATLMKKIDNYYSGHSKIKSGYLHRGVSHVLNKNFDEKE